MSRSAVDRLGVARAQLELARASSSGGNVAGRARLGDYERKVAELEREVAESTRDRRSEALDR